MGEELCLHFVPTYTKHQHEDFVIFVPSLACNPELSEQSICPRGPDCACNMIRWRLLNDVPRKVLLADAAVANLMLLESAMEDERQGVQALACAIGVPIYHVEKVLEEEGYVLTRDFTSSLSFCRLVGALFLFFTCRTQDMGQPSLQSTPLSISKGKLTRLCCVLPSFSVSLLVSSRNLAGKILELLARWRSRVPAILVGESGTGKTRALQLLTRLLLESQEVRPDVPREARAARGLLSQWQNPENGCCPLGFPENKLKKNTCFFL